MNHSSALRIGKRVTTAVFIAAVMALMLSGTALAAGSVSKSGSTATFNAGAGDTNNLTISYSWYSMYFEDTGATVTAGSGCSAVNANKVRCGSFFSTVNTAVANLNDQNDAAKVLSSVPSSKTVTLNGGDGSDQLNVFNSTAVAKMNLNGNAGGDTIYGGSGADNIDGGPGADGDHYGYGGNDTMTDDGLNTLFGGDGNDTITLTTTQPNYISAVYGQAGNDIITGAAGRELLSGGDGDDIVHGGGENDALDGGPGNDQVFGDDGNDQLFNGANSGTDVYQGDAGVDYAMYCGVVDLTISLDGVANDGVAGENDNAKADVEDIRHGGGGWGCSGSNFGTDGNDVFTGNSSANTINGYAGNDTITGGGGSDALNGGDGDDTINATDGVVDTITCGNGTDAVDADAIDVVAADCENVTLH